LSLDTFFKISICQSPGFTNQFLSLIGGLRINQASNILLQPEDYDHLHNQLIRLELLSTMLSRLLQYFNNNNNVFYLLIIRNLTTTLYLIEQLEEKTSDVDDNEQHFSLKDFVTNSETVGRPKLEIY
jgi:hypothetical protein